MTYYKTFKRSATNWAEFANAEKIECETDLTRSEAYELCKEFNDNRTDEEIAAGTKMEFTAQD